MYSVEPSQAFAKKMQKLMKKDRLRYERVKKKSAEICSDPHHYEPLGNVLAGVFHAHIDPFVLTFRIDEENKKVIFIDFDHHDRIFKN